ncbi:MBL fold metallo-hydrolase [Streptacidiphilus sp. N1-3]|uniref:MBL fold metallo-hydrolase n=1 Tax=Streptacidiphilus alkalitolerans TaxID=3342712 RepID=A0ABV6WUU7_9ACTN
MSTDRTRDWREVADRVFQRRYDPWDVTVVAVVGADGLAVVDTRCSPAEARELREHLRQLSPAPVRWVVNTHAHFDHVGGNTEFLPPRQVPGAELWGHRAAAAEMTGMTKTGELTGTAVPDRLVDRAHTLDLGDRAVQLRYLGRGHTGGDLVLHLPDADALLAGDLVEQSGPPAYGSDSYPLDWSPTLDALLALTGPDTVVVPGHGTPVDPGFVRAQRDTVAAVAARLTALHASGVPAASAPAAGQWPYPAEGLRDAALRAYAQLDGTLR